MLIRFCSNSWCEREVVVLQLNEDNAPKSRNRYHWRMKKKIMVSLFFSELPLITLEVTARLSDIE